MIVFISLYFSILIHAISPAPEPVEIGLLVPDQGRMGQEAIHATQMAFDKANENGGFNGRPFELIVRSCEGPWGVGSTASVKLVYDDKVLAILGSLDGRNAHLAEQVAAKSQIVLMSTRATDPSLSRAYVPWYFRVIPDDIQQAHALIKVMVEKHDEQNFLVLTTDEYDAKSGAEAFIKVAANLKIKTPQLHYLNSDPGNENEFLNKVNGPDLNALVVFGTPSNCFSVLKKLKSIKPHIQVYASSFMLSDIREHRLHPDISENMVIIAPNFWYMEKGQNFIKAFKSDFGYTPGIIGAYAHDGALLLTKLIKKVGLNKQNICDELRKTVFSAPLIGSVRFDEHGNNIGTVGIIRIKDGQPSAYK